MLTAPHLTVRHEAGADLSTLVWRLPRPMCCVSTAAIGGGFSESAWVVNAQVASGYHRDDLELHGAEIAAALDLTGPGVVMLTAVDVRTHHAAAHEDAYVLATVGVTDPTWAADPAVDSRSLRNAPTPAGTVNVVVSVPRPVAPAGLVNLVATVTEAKCQAFADLAVPGTGTPSDAVTVLCPIDGKAESFGGPRSLWGARVANATYDAVVAGVRGLRDGGARC